MLGSTGLLNRNLLNLPYFCVPRLFMHVLPYLFRSGPQKMAVSHEVHIVANHTQIFKMHLLSLHRHFRGKLYGPWPTTWQNTCKIFPLGIFWLGFRHLGQPMAEPALLPYATKYAGLTACAIAPAINFDTSIFDNSDMTWGPALYQNLSPCICIHLCLRKDNLNLWWDYRKHSE